MFSAKVVALHTYLTDRLTIALPINLATPELMSTTAIGASSVTVAQAATYWGREYMTQVATRPDNSLREVARTVFGIQNYKPGNVMPALITTLQNLHRGAGPAICISPAQGAAYLFIQKIVSDRLSPHPALTPTTWLEKHADGIGGFVAGLGETYMVAGKEYQQVWESVQHQPACRSLPKIATPKAGLLSEFLPNTRALVRLAEHHPNVRKGVFCIGLRNGPLGVVTFMESPVDPETRKNHPSLDYGFRALMIGGTAFAGAYVDSAKVGFFSTTIKRGFRFALGYTRMSAKLATVRAVRTAAFGSIVAAPFHHPEIVTSAQRAARWFAQRTTPHMPNQFDLFSLTYRSNAFYTKI